MPDDTNDPFLTVGEAAKVLRMAKRTLDNHRSKKTGPKFRRHGGRVVYRFSDLLQWSEQRATRTMASSKRPAPSSGHPQRDRHSFVSPSRAEGRHSDAALERQSKYSHRSLHDDRENAGEGKAGGHPTC